VQGEVKYIERGVEHAGTYKVDGWMLELTCCYGTRRAALGLFEQKTLARRLLKYLVAKAGREVADSAPHPATIEATKTADQAGSVRAHKS